MSEVNNTGEAILMSSALFVGFLCVLYEVYYFWLEGAIIIAFILPILAWRSIDNGASKKNNQLANQKAEWEIRKLQAEVKKIQGG